MSHPLPFFLPTVLPGPFDPPPRIAGSLTPDDADEVADLILSEYLESPLLLDLVRSYRNAVASRDATAVSVYEDVLDVGRAVGVWLDLLGRVVGEPRDGRDDIDYRRGIRVRVLVNRANGRVAELAKIARLHESADDDPAAQIRIREPGRARAIVYIDATPSTPLRRVNSYLQGAKAGGVALQAVQVVTPFERTDAFRLVTVDLAGTRDVYGLADTALTLGGALAHVLPS